MANNILGIDYGQKRVGLALAANGESPQRLQTLSGGTGLLDAVAAVAQAHRASTVVVGLPRNLDGDDTSQTSTVRAFIEELEARLPQATVVTQDEAVTSELARQRLAGQNNQTDELIDQEAAVIILEDYLREG